MRVLAVIGMLAIVVAIAAGVYFFGGYYDVSANKDDPKLVEWMLIKVREASLDKRSDAKPPIKLDDAAAVQEGARAFALHGCANCHGAPGVEWSKFSEGLNPGPPDLKDIPKDDTPGHLFAIIRNGIRMTGMPSFAKAAVADDEIWKIVAFVKKLPDVKDTDYKAWISSAPAPRQ